MKNKIICLLLSAVLLLSGLIVNSQAALCESLPPDISADAAVVIEGSTGAILYEKNKDKELIPASITKIMTLILIFEAIDSGKLKLTD